jgi:hypothetical protein
MQTTVKLEKVLKSCLRLYVCAKWKQLEEIESIDDSECSNYYKLITSTEKPVKEEGVKLKALFTISPECQQYLRWIVDKVIEELTAIDKTIDNDAFLEALNGMELLSWMPAKFPKVTLEQCEINYGELSAFRCLIINKLNITSAQAEIVVAKIDRLINDIAHVAGSILRYNKMTINAKFLSGILAMFGLDPMHIDEMKASLREPKKKAPKVVDQLR